MTGSVDPSQTWLGAHLIVKAHTAPLSGPQIKQLNELAVGMDRALGIELCSLGPAGAQARLTVTERHLQPGGIVNGGVYSALAESTGSYASTVVAGMPMVGVNNSTDFLASVRKGVIEASARPIHCGRRTHLWEISMTCEDRLVALCRLRTMPAPGASRPSS